MMDDLADDYDRIAERCEADAMDLYHGHDPKSYWFALEKAAEYYRSKARNLRTVTNARALSEVNNG